MTNQMRWMNTLFKRLAISAAVLIIFAAILSSVFRSLTPWAKQYKGEVAQHLSLLLGQPVTIQTMETGWYWFQPVVQLKQVSLVDGSKTTLNLDKLSIGINLLKSLMHWRIEPGVLYIDGISLVLRQKEGHWKMDALSGSGLTNTTMTKERSQQLIAWLAQQERLIIRHVSAQLHFSDGALIPLSEINLSIVNSSGYYKLKGEALLAQTNPTSVQFLGELRFNPFAMTKTSGHFYLSAKKIAPAQWQNVIPLANLYFEGGKGNVALWMDLKNGAVSAVQAQVKFKRLAWRLQGNKDRQFIQAFSANTAWKPDEKGWLFEADKIALRIGGVQWPENKAMLHFDKEQQSYQVFVKSILIESLLANVMNWPQALAPVLQSKPHGLLTDTQLMIKDKQPTALLTRFDQLGWTGGKNLPTVNQLSGVLNWQPEEGRLEIDSQQTTIGLKGYPSQAFDLLNLAVDWKELGNGLRVSMERFVLRQPDFSFTAEGAFDQVTREGMGHVQLNAGFAGKNMARWLAYLPKNHLKPKLYAWLKNDVKQIGEASGQIHITGFAQDFPFDDNKGELVINTHASDVVLFINKKWPLLKSLEGYLRIKNRKMEVDLIHGDFQGVLVNQLNLILDDIGKNKETLLAHGLVNASAQDMLAFILASPLNKKLAALTLLKISGPALLDFHLEVPLYPENDNVLAQGDVTFNDNKVLVTHQVGSVQLDDFAGQLHFTEKQVTDSAFTANAWGYPLNLKIQSQSLPHPHTLVRLDGQCSVDSLKSRLTPAVLSLMKGHFGFQVDFKLTDDPNDLDRINLSSDLSGLSIDLPAPLGKKHNTKAPVVVNLDFNVKKSLRVRTRYDERISSDILFVPNNDSFQFKSGQIRLGRGEASSQNKPGLALVGSLDGFNLSQWASVFKTLQAAGGQSDLQDNVRLLNLTFGKLTVFKQGFDHLLLKAQRQPDKSWSLQIEQKKVAANLTYQPLTKTLSGQIQRLQLDKLDDAKGLKESSPQYGPGDVPNLNLHLDNLSVGGIEIGAMTIKSQSTQSRFLIDYCRIESVGYQMNVEGEWTQKEKKNSTKIHFKMNLKDLAKSLDRWHITPAVDARKGEVEFRGAWDNAIYRFSLAKLSGRLYLKLNNGIITHLSPETESKLGLGKLLSILSLQTIPRRLKLDFSDLSAGYSFDVFKGNFILNKGIMTTQDSYIDGPVAYASMKGNLDLVRRLYDLDLSISPHITASLPLVATIAGGPIAGIAAWVANKIINKSMQKVSAYTYKISGPWVSPVVQQMSIVKHKPVASAPNTLREEEDR